MIFIHYGSEHFDRTRFCEVKNGDGLLWLQKPTGGLWGSPVDSVYGWARWCDDNEFSLSNRWVYGRIGEDATDIDAFKWNDKVPSFKFKLKDGAKIITLEKLDDFIKLKDDGFRATINSLDSLPEEYREMAEGEIDESFDYNKLRSGFPVVPMRARMTPDFEKIRDAGYSAILFTHTALTSQLIRTWDCDCVLVLDGDSVEEA